MAQRDAPDLQRAVFEYRFVGGCIDFVPLDGIRQLAVEEAQMVLQYFAEGRRSIDGQGSPTAIETECREQREDAVAVVAVQMGQEDGPQLERVDPVAEELLLGTLTGIEQVILLLKIDRLRRRMASGRRLG